MANGARPPTSSRPGLVDRIKKPHQAPVCRRPVPPAGGTKFRDTAFCCKTHTYDDRGGVYECGR